MFANVARGWVVTLLALGAATWAQAAPKGSAGQAERPLKVGLIGLDTSHVVEFTRLLNDASRADHVPGARVVAGFRGGSPDVEASATRLEKFTAELEGSYRIEIVPSIEALLAKVDVVMITSVDGRAHLEQARRVFAAGKRVFIDKPLAASYADAREIIRLASASKTPFFSSSSLRFVPEIAGLRADSRLGGTLGATSYGPAPYEPHHPDLMWYGIHSVEILYTLMGPGCVAVSRTYSPGADVVVGRWKDGRLGVVRGGRDGARSYGAVAFGKEANVAAQPKGGYRELLVEIVKFFQTGTPPVAPAETLEMIAFIAAADLSRARAGAEVPLAEVTARSGAR